MDDCVCNKRKATAALLHLKCDVRTGRRQQSGFLAPSGGKCYSWVQKTWEKLCTVQHVWRSWPTFQKTDWGEVTAKLHSKDALHVILIISFWVLLNHKTRSSQVFYCVIAVGMKRGSVSVFTISRCLWRSDRRY